MADEEENRGTRSEYHSKAASMRNATFIIGFIGYVLISQVWAAYGYYNSWYYVGGWGLAILIGMFLLGPLIVANRSPKFSSAKMGGTIALPQPILTVPAQGGWPEMVMYDPGSVRGYGIEEHRASTKGYVWLPGIMAIVLGEGGRGVNVNANAKLVQLSEHCELAPHLYDAMIKYPRYKPDVPMWVGLFPELINSPTVEQLEYFKRRCEDFGISRKAFDGEGDGKKPAFRAVLEEYASALSRFRYPEMERPERTFDNIFRSQASQIDTLRKEIDVWKSDVSALHDLAKYAREPKQEPGFFERTTGITPPGNRNQNNQDQNEDGRRY